MKGVGEGRRWTMKIGNGLLGVHESLTYTLRRVYAVSRQGASPWNCTSGTRRYTELTMLPACQGRNKGRPLDSDSSVPRAPEIFVYFSCRSVDRAATQRCVSDCPLRAYQPSMSGCGQATKQQLYRKNDMDQGPTAEQNRAWKASSADLA